METKSWLMFMFRRWSKSGCLGIASKARCMSKKSCIPPHVLKDGSWAALWWTLRCWFRSSCLVSIQCAETRRMASCADRNSTYANCGQRTMVAWIALLNFRVMIPSTFLPRGSIKAIARRLSKQQGALLGFGRKATHACRHYAGTKIWSFDHQTSNWLYKVWASDCASGFSTIPGRNCGATDFTAGVLAISRASSSTSNGIPWNGLGARWILEGPAHFVRMNSWVRCRTSSDDAGAPVSLRIRIFFRGCLGV